MNKVRIAVVGGGHLGRIHARLLSMLDSVELIGVVEPSAEARRLIAEQGHRSVASMDEIIGELDAAVVAAPSVAHHEIAKRLIDANIDLLVEKPLATNSQDAESIARHAERIGVILQVGHVERFNPAFATAIDNCAEPRFISGIRSGPFTFRCTDVGVVLDLMIHDIDLILAAVDSEVSGLDAFGMSVLTEHEDIADARITFENGCVAHLHASRVAFLPERRMSMINRQQQVIVDFGSRKTIVIAYPSAGCEHWERLSIDQRKARQESLFEELLPARTIEPAESNPLLEELTEFVDCVRSREEPRVTGNAACQAITVAEAICECIRRQAAMAPGSISIPMPDLARVDSPRRKAG